MDDFAFPMAESPQRSLTSPGSDSNSLKDRLFDIQDLQAKVLEYQRDNVLLKREIELKEAKLLSCMRSIDLFWSPELKKERKKRQEEEEKVNKMMADLERLKKSKDDSSDSPIQFLSARLHGDVLSNKGGSQSPRKENVRKTVEEMELRFEKQKATLAQREETIKKLLERLQKKTAEMNALQEEMNHSLEGELSYKLEAAQTEITSLHNQKAQWEYKLHKLEKQGKETAENFRQKQLELEEARQRALECSSHIASLQTAVEQKDIQLSQLMQLVYERNAQYSEVRENQETMAQDRDEDRRQIEALQSHGKFLRAKIESLKNDLALKDDLVRGIEGRSREEAVLLQETVTAKTKQCERLQKNVKSMTEKLMAKDRTIGNLEAVNHDLVSKKDELASQLKANEREMSSLRRRITNLEADVNEKEEMLTVTKNRLVLLRGSQSEDSSDVVRSLEEQLEDQSRHVKMLREQREREDREREEERDLFKQNATQLKFRVKKLSDALEVTETKLTEAEKQRASLAAENTQRNSEIFRLKETLDETKAELEKMRESSPSSKGGDQRIAELQKEIKSKSLQVAELERSATDLSTKLVELKRAQKLERQMNAQLLGEVKRRQGQETHREDRISQLEESLKESLELAIKRDKEMDADREKFLRSDKEFAALKETFDKRELERAETESRLAKMTSDLQDREALIVSLRAERQRQMEEVMEMKQSSLLAEISERDANIALLETSTARKKEHKAAILALKTEKDRLVSELKDWTRKQIQLKQSAEEEGGESRLTQKLLNATPEQVFQAIRNMEERTKRLRTYIDQLLAAVLEQNPNLLEGMPRQQQSQGKLIENLRGTSLEELLSDLRDRERDNFDLQGYANLLLQRIMENQPSILESVGAMQT